jgi:hypothetical protein
MKSKISKIVVTESNDKPQFILRHAKALKTNYNEEWNDTTITTYEIEEGYERYCKAELNGADIMSWRWLI